MMRRTFRKNKVARFGFSLRGIQFSRFCLIALLLCGLCAVSLADEEQEESPISDAVHEGLQAALEAINVERNPRYAPLTIFRWLYHQDSWGTQAMYEEYGSFGIDNCLSAVPTMQKRSDILFGWKFTIADMSCDVYQARVSFDRKHSVICDEMSVSPNLSPTTGIGLAQIELFKTVRNICEPVVVEPEEAPADEEQPTSNGEASAPAGSPSASQEQESGDRSPAQSRSSDSGGTNTGGRNTGGSSTGCANQIGWTSTRLGLSGGSYSSDEGDLGGGCVTKNLIVKGPGGEGPRIAVEIRGREHCLKSNWEEMLENASTTGTAPSLSDIFKSDC